MGILTESGARPAKKARIAPTKGTKGRARSPPPKAKAPAAREEEQKPSTKSKGKAKETTDEAAPPPLPTSFKVVAGSYEKLLYGLEGTVSPVDPESPQSSTRKYKFDLKPLFIFPAHVSCIKAVAASPQGGKWLATGSADEIIKVWDLKRRKELGGLMQHQGGHTS